MSIIDEIMKNAFTQGGYGTTEITGEPLPKGPKVGGGSGIGSVPLPAGYAPEQLESFPQSQPSGGLPNPQVPLPQRKPEPTPEAINSLLTAKILGRECQQGTDGGKCYDDSQPSNVSNFGVTQDTLKELRLPHSKQDVRNMKLEDAEGILNSKYVAATGVNKLPFRTSDIISDAVVNRGQRSGIKHLQNALRNMGAMRKEDVDGILGRKTLEAVDKVLGKHDEQDLVNAIIEDRERVYRIIDKKQKAKAEAKGEPFESHINGWLNRLDEWRET